MLTHLRINNTDPFGTFFQFYWNYENIVLLPFPNKREKIKYKHVHKWIWNLHKKGTQTWPRVCVCVFQNLEPGLRHTGTFSHTHSFILNLMCTLLQAELARLFTHLHYGRFNIVHLSQIASKRYTPNGYYAWKVFNHNMYRMSFEAKLNQKVENHKCNECLE